jgi:hypothetical protein
LSRTFIGGIWHEGDLGEIQAERTAALVVRFAFRYLRTGIGGRGVSHNNKCPISGFGEFKLNIVKVFTCSALQAVLKLEEEKVTVLLL